MVLHQQRVDVEEQRLQLPWGAQLAGMRGWWVPHRSSCPVPPSSRKTDVCWLPTSMLPSSVATGLWLTRSGTPAGSLCVQRTHAAGGGAPTAAAPGAPYGPPAACKTSAACQPASQPCVHLDAWPANIGRDVGIQAAVCAREDGARSPWRLPKPCIVRWAGQHSCSCEARPRWEQGLLIPPPSSPPSGRETADACAAAAWLADDIRGAPLSNVHSRCPVSLSSATSCPLARQTSRARSRLRSKQGRGMEVAGSSSVRSGGNGQDGGTAAARRRQQGRRQHAAAPKRKVRLQRNGEAV